jgi:hypothetical protein
VRSLKIFLAAALSVAALGCGLPNPYFLTAPTAGSFPAGLATTCTFISPGYAAGSNFTGFVVYYKIIPPGTPSTTDINLGGGGTTGPFVLQANGFYSMSLATDNPSSPSLPVIVPASADVPNPLTVTLDLANSNYSYSVGGTSTSPIGIGRGGGLANVQSPYTGTRSFAPLQTTPNYQASDTDMGSGVYNSCDTTRQAYIILYALSFGVTGTSQEWSVPVYLGYIGISFP